MADLVGAEESFLEKRVHFGRDSKLFSMTSPAPEPPNASDPDADDVNQHHVAQVIGLMQMLLESILPLVLDDDRDTWEAHAEQAQITVKENADHNESASNSESSDSSNAKTQLQVLLASRPNIPVKKGCPVLQVSNIHWDTSIAEIQALFKSITVLTRNLAALRTPVASFHALDPSPHAPYHWKIRNRLLYRV